MPQITLECSDNIIEKNMHPLLLEIHHLLSERLPTELSSCKSRVIRINHYLVGDGASQNAFVHLTISVLKGRSEELLKSIAQTILEKLKISFHESLLILNVQLTIAMQDLPNVYLKDASNSGN